jgi:hypothetical protein
MRRSMAVLAALTLALVLPATVSAAKATRLTDHTVSIDCEELHPTSGTGFAFFGASTSDLNGPDAFLDAWNGNEPVGDSDHHRDFDQPADVTWNGTTLSGSFPIVDGNGDPAGMATFSATLTPLGDPNAIDDNFKNGNTKFRATGTSQPMQPAGSLVLSTGQTFDLGTCFGDESTISTFATNPASFVNHFTARTTDCPLANTAGDTGFLFVDLSNETDVFIDSAAVPADGSPEIEAVGGATAVGNVIDAPLDTFFPDTGEPAGVAASIHMTVTDTGEAFVRMFSSRERRQVVRGTLLDIEGTLTIGSHTFDLGACVGADYRSKVLFSAAKGPKPGGKVPTNDLPSGAKSLAIGGSANVQTKGASPDREATFDCVIFEDENGAPFEVPVANTVWYKFTGTGGSVTVSTAGSDFDTVLATYTAGPGGTFTPVLDGCNDDVPTPPVGRSLQAAVTIPTVSGTTYYVQIGGFPDSAFPFGNLRVSIR